MNLSNFCPRQYSFHHCFTAGLLQLAYRNEADSSLATRMEHLGQRLNAACSVGNAIDSSSTTVKCSSLAKPDYIFASRRSTRTENRQQIWGTALAIREAREAPVASPTPSPLSQKYRRCTTVKQESVLQRRQAVLDVAYQLHRERFVRSAPKPPQVPGEVWINKPVSVT